MAFCLEKAGFLEVEGDGVRRLLWVVVVLLVVSGGCAGEEAPRIELQVVADGSRVLPTTTDLGYVVALSEARMVMSDVLFTVRGEEHAGKGWIGDWLVAPAYAHPGHHHGGEVSGEMPGRFVVDWLSGDGGELGRATLLAGGYESANFSFGYGTSADSLEADDALMGRTAVLRGVATRESDAQEYGFVALIEANRGRVLVGAPFELDVTVQTKSRLGFRLVTTDPNEGDSLFDGIDFAALAGDAGLITLSESNENEAIRENYFRLRRTFQTHDHFEIVVLDD